MSKTVVLPLRDGRERIGIRPRFAGSAAMGQTAAFDVAVVSGAGAAMGGRSLAWRLYREGREPFWYRQADGSWGYREITADTTVDSGEIRTSVGASEPSRVALALGWGNYRLEVTEPRDSGALPASVRFRVGWGGTGGPEIPDMMTVRLDRRRYAPGDTADVKLEAPFDGIALVTVLTDRVAQLHSAKVIDGNSDPVDPGGVPPTLPPGERPGLAVTLGGSGLSLEQLVTLYVALGSDGRVRPLRLDPEAEAAKPAELLDADAARTVAAILKHAPLATRHSAGASLGGCTGVRRQDRHILRLPRRLGRGGVDGNKWLECGSAGWTAPRGLATWAATTPCRLLHGVFGLLPSDPARRLLEPARALSEPAPLALRDFDNGTKLAGPPVPKLTLDFPPDGATLKLSRGGRFRPMPLRAKGGAGPVRWLVNGRPVENDVWRPDGPGAATITALDTPRQWAGATVWVE